MLQNSMTGRHDQDAVDAGIRGFGTERKLIAHSSSLVIVAGNADAPCFEKRAINYLIAKLMKLFGVAGEIDNDRSPFERLIFASELFGECVVAPTQCAA